MVVKFISQYFEASRFSVIFVGYFTMKYVNKFIHPIAEKLFNKADKNIDINLK